MRSDAGALGMELAHISQIAQDHEAQSPIIEDCIIMGGSYDPTDGTASAGVGDSFSPLDDDPNGQTLVYEKVRLGTPQIGDQYGPVGGERVDLHPTYGGQLAVFKHGPDDSPNAPPGERWMMHTPLQTIIANGGKLGNYTQGLKFTNDGATPGDGLGGMTRHSSSYVADSTAGGWKTILDDTGKVASTVSPEGHTIKIDSTAGTLTMRTADGSVQTLLTQAGKLLQHIAGSAEQHFDGITGEASTVASLIGLGDRFGNLSAAANAAINKTHLTSLGSNIDALHLSVISKTVSTLASAGAFQPGFSVSSYIALLVAGFFDSLGIPDGSSIVRIK